MQPVPLDLGTVQIRVTGLKVRLLPSATPASHVAHIGACSILLTAALRGLLGCEPLADKGARSSCNSCSLAVITCSCRRDSSAALGKADRPCAGISLQCSQAEHENMTVKGIIQSIGLSQLQRVVQEDMVLSTIETIKLYAGKRKEHDFCLQE